MQRATAGRGRTAPARRPPRPAAAIRRACVVGPVPVGRSRGSSMSTTERSGLPPRPRASSVDQVGAAARRSSAQARSDSYSSHRPITFLRKRIVPSTPPSLVKLARRAASVSTGSSSSSPTSDHVPRGDVGDGARSPPAPRRRPRRCRGSRPRSPVTPLASADLGRRLAAAPGRPSSRGRRSGGRIARGCPSRSARSTAHGRSDVEQPGRGGVGALGARARRSASSASRSGSSSSVAAASSAPLRAAATSW